MNGSDSLPPPQARCSIAPGKLILSGEHAVVHGRPALAIACAPFARVSITPGAADRLDIDLPDLQMGRSWDLKTARQRMAVLCERHEAFLSGNLAIDAVLTDPGDLVVAASFEFFRRSSMPPCGARVEVRSSIPAGSGMGSSAAVLVATLHAWCGAMQRDVPLESLAEWAADVEHLLHGRSSGLDPTLCALGGALRFRKGAATERVPGRVGGLWIVQTGPPRSGTGECVAQVGDRFGGSAIWEEFAEVTRHMERAWREGAVVAFGESLRANHRLLVRIGVVPEPVAAFIHAVEADGGAAKVCGAGAVRGDRAGVVLVQAAQAPAALCAAHGYALSPCEPEEAGVRGTAPR